MPNVYVVQRQFRYDANTGQVLPKYDLTAAEVFGELRVILTDRAGVDRPAQAIAKMNLILSNFSDADYLLLIGHPVLIGWATALAAAHNNGRVQHLVWSGATNSYKTVACHLPVQALVL